MSARLEKLCSLLRVRGSGGASTGGLPWLCRKEGVLRADNNRMRRGAAGKKHRYAAVLERAAQCALITEPVGAGLGRAERRAETCTC